MTSQFLRGVTVPRLSIALALVCAPAATAQSLDENFNTVSGQGGGSVLIGSGFNVLTDWDDGISGESAFAGTLGNARFNPAAAFGSATSGVGGTGAGVIDIQNVMFNILDESFDAVTGSGGGPFLVGDGLTPDTFGFTPSWDDGILGEGAFGGTFGGGILAGGMFAQGLPGGGQANGGGRLDVFGVNITSGNWYAGLQWDIGPLPGATPLNNPGFEDGPTGLGIVGWTRFGNVYTEALSPRSGARHAKFFGTFPGTSGFFQSLPAQPGQTWELDGYSRHNTGDAITGTGNTVVMRVEFYDAGGVQLLGQQATVLDGTSPLNTWIDNSPVQLTAPAGTTQVRPVFLFVQAGSQGGAGYIDDVTFRIVGGPPSVNLAEISLTATVRGAADAAGETLGAVQLRMEDSAGNRLLFNQVANGSFQAIGGPLSTAVEADANGVPTPGAFNVNSPGFTVVVAFNNDGLSPWGTGGTLTVDNLNLSNNDSAGSEWYAGLFWDNLTTTITDLDQLQLTADVKGSVPGGDYELRIEAFRETQAGLSENFSGVTGIGGANFLDAAAITGGQTFGFAPGWDTGISGEAAFGGVFGVVDVFAPGGFSATGLTSGGNTGGAGEIRVENLILGGGGGWFAGLQWGGQGLASGDLSEVTLTANIRGQTASGGNLGDFELRLEDTEGDRMYFSGTADGSWQSVGGLLSTATEGPRLGGGGDGNFDLDDPSYTVVISFVNPESTWIFGGVLQVDNLFLTPLTIRTEIGRVSFTGDATGSFQSAGGLLSTGTTNFGDFTRDFNSVTGVGGGINGPWDTGLSDENSFFGTFGGASGGSAIAEGCAGCGNPGAGARVSVSNVTNGAGGWFAGAYFTGVPADLTGDLSQINLTADIRGAANTGAGESLGEYFFRIEDADLTALSFTVTANGAFQTVGGPLSTATLVQVNSGDGVFDRNQETYNITLGFLGTSSNWGPGGTLTIDNIFLTGVSFGDADTYSVVLAFNHEIPTWGTSGRLTVDNLLFGPAAAYPRGDTNCDGSVDFFDIDPFLLALFDPGAYAATYCNGSTNTVDVDCSNSVDFFDIDPFLACLFGGCLPCP